MQLVVFDVETDRLLSRARDNWTELRVTTCVAVSSRLVLSPPTASTENERVHEFVLFDDEDATERFGALMDAADAVVAYNGRDFDLRVLRNHCDAARVDGWATRLIDPFEAMRKATNSWVKLDDLLDANGLPGKSASGVDAVRWWQDGERSKVMEYCRRDALGLQRLVAMDRLNFPVKRWTKEGRQEVSHHAVLRWHDYVRSKRLE
jgi:hypothetical protein